MRNGVKYTYPFENAGVLGSNPGLLGPRTVPGPVRIILFKMESFDDTLAAAG